MSELLQNTASLSRQSISVPRLRKEDVGSFNINKLPECFFISLLYYDEQFIKRAKLTELLRINCKTHQFI